MNKKKIYLLGSFFTVVVVLIIGIQIYFIRSLFMLKEELFHHDIGVVLEHVAEQLDVEENKKRNEFKEHLNHFLYTGEIIDPSDTVFLGILKNNTFLITNLQGHLQLDEINRNALINKVLASVNWAEYRKIEHRLSIPMLDSLITREMSVKDLHVPYFYTVSYDHGQVLLSKNEKLNALILQSPYTIRLYSNELLMQPVYLHLYIPRVDEYIIDDKIYLICYVSIFLCLIIIAGFSATLHIILKQKNLNDIKNDFISNMTHELKTPIATISLAGEALRDPAFFQDEGLREKYLTIIREEIKRLSVMVESVLKSATWSEPKIKLKVEKVNMHDLLTEVAQNFSLQIHTRQGSLSLNFSAENPMIDGDKAHLTSAISNIIDNAIKYSPDKPVINVSTRNEADGIEIAVSDRGVGIKKSELKKIFERFYRVPSGNVHNVKGFGLGLSYARDIVEKHGGHIKVESEYGKGSKFIIYLPFKIKSITEDGRA